MLMTTDMNLTNLSRGNMCLRLRLQPSELTHTHTHTQSKVGHVKQVNVVFQRQPAIGNVLKKQRIEQLVEILRLKFESF